MSCPLGKNRPIKVNSMNILVERLQGRMDAGLYNVGGREPQETPGKEVNEAQESWQEAVIWSFHLNKLPFLFFIEKEST